MSNNTVSRIGTHFLRGVELIEERAKQMSVHSENWAYPVCSFGIPKDSYYGEIWCNGMDWQNTYWLLESVKHEKPTAQPLLIFDRHQEEEAFEEKEDFLVEILRLRRALTWLQDVPSAFPRDGLLTYVYQIEGNNTESEWSLDKVMRQCVLTHASQSPIVFRLNTTLVSTVKPHPLGRAGFSS